jgi:hypothetical protein
VREEEEVEDEDEDEVRESKVDERRWDRSVVSVSCILSIRCVPVPVRQLVNQKTVARERKIPKTGTWSSRNKKTPKNSGTKAQKPKNPPKNIQRTIKLKAPKKNQKKTTHPLLPLNILTPLPPCFLHVVQELGIFCCYAGEVFGSGGWGGCWGGRVGGGSVRGGGVRMGWGGGRRDEKRVREEGGRKRVTRIKTEWKNVEVGGRKQERRKPTYLTPPTSGSDGDSIRRSDSRRVSESDILRRRWRRAWSWDRVKEW